MPPLQEALAAPLGFLLLGRLLASFVYRHLPVATAAIFVGTMTPFVIAILIVCWERLSDAPLLLGFLLLLVTTTSAYSLGWIADQVALQLRQRKSATVPVRT